MILRAENISKKYMRKTRESNFFYAVKQAELSLEPGKITEIIGRSGSGKTTLLNMLAGLLAPSEGKVYLDDQDLYALSDKELSRLRNRTIGVVPQGQTGLDSLTVLENVMLPRLLYEKDPDCSKKAWTLLEKMHIKEIADAWPRELSGGELRRLAIARAMITEPCVILADEPTGDLDDENTAAVLALFKEIAEEGTAVLMVTHEAGARQYADYIYRMDGGSLSQVSGEARIEDIGK
ncbi:MAG: ABC transporter ATP-binding protein [Eubacterium sp.]|nr:ABC transporter ATP-binding protein [Eubacterium sp.]